MRGAIASVEIYATEDDGSVRRLSLTIAAPERSPGGEGWQCRVALADLHRPEAVGGADSVEALAGALARARGWVAELRAEGLVLARDRAGKSLFDFV